MLTHYVVINYPLDQSADTDQVVKKYPNEFSIGDLVPFPHIDPIIFEIGPLAIRWYSLAYIAGILCGWLYGRSLIANKNFWYQRVPPLDAERWLDFIFWAIIGIILGGRLGYILFYQLELYLANPSDIYKVWQGGMSYHGGLIGLVTVTALFAFFKKIPLLSILDLIACISPIGIFFGRIANFINAELYGRVTTMPWGVIFPGGGPDPRHPSQLYEAALEGFVMFIFLRIVTHFTSGLKHPGRVAGYYGVLYGLFRIIIENFRMPDVQIGFLFGGYTMGMLLSAPMILIGLLLIALSFRTPKSA